MEGGKEGGKEGGRFKEWIFRQSYRAKSYVTFAKITAFSDTLKHTHIKTTPAVYISQYRTCYMHIYRM